MTTGAAAGSGPGAVAAPASGGDDGSMVAGAAIAGAASRGPPGTCTVTIFRASSLPVPTGRLASDDAGICAGVCPDAGGTAPPIGGGAGCWGVEGPGSTAGGPDVMMADTVPTCTKGVGPAGIQLMPGGNGCGPTGNVVGFVGTGCAATGTAVALLCARY